MRLAVVLLVAVVSVLQVEKSSCTDVDAFEKKFVNPPPAFSKFGRDPSKWRQKKPTGYLKKKFRTLEKEEYRRKKVLSKPDLKYGKMKAKASMKGQKFLKNEKYQLCQSLSEDSVKDTLIKFGVVTHIIPDVEKFRTTMKSLRDAVPPPKKKYSDDKKNKKNKKMKKQIRLSQTNYVGRSMGGLLPPQIDEFGIYEDESNNNLEDGGLSREKRAVNYNDVHAVKHKGKSYRRYKSKGSLSKDYKNLMPSKVTISRRQGRQSFSGDSIKDKRRKGTGRNFDQVPLCYGWRYLSAINAITQDDSADVDTLSQSVSDMLDISFADTVANIIQTCGEMLDKPTGLCPPMEDPRGDDTCESQCQVDSDCGYKELCCRQQCSNKCISILGSNYNKCGLGDQYMQCVYNMIDTQLCDA